MLAMMLMLMLLMMLLIGMVAIATIAIVSATAALPPYGIEPRPDSGLPFFPPLPALVTLSPPPVPVQTKTKLETVAMIPATLWKYQAQQQPQTKKR